MTTDPAYVERSRAIREHLFAQHQHCASCHTRIFYCWNGPGDTKKEKFWIPPLGGDYSQPLVCVKCWEKASGHD